MHSSSAIAKTRRRNPDIVYGITASGKRRALYPSNLEPAWIVHDARATASTADAPVP